MLKQKIVKILPEPFVVFYRNMRTNLLGRAEDPLIYTRYAFKWATERVLPANEKEWWQKYAGIKAYFANAPKIYRPSPLWNKLGARFMRLLYVNGMDFCRNEKVWGDFINWNDSLLCVCYLYTQILEKIDTLNLLSKVEESTKFETKVYMVDGKRRTIGQLEAMSEFYNVYPELEKAKHANGVAPHYVVGEIGSGWGRTANMFLKALPNVTYIFIDLPESLFVSEYYFSKEFPNEPMMMHDESIKRSVLTREELKKYRAVFLTPDQFEKLEDKSLDAFININSFQEMLPEVIENYFSIIDKKVNGVFYFKQFYKDDNVAWRKPIGLEFYPIRSQWKKVWLKKSLLWECRFEALYRI